MMKSSDNHPITFRNHPISQSAEGRRNHPTFIRSTGTIIRCYVEPACTTKETHRIGPAITGDQHRRLSTRAGRAGGGPNKALLLKHITDSKSEGAPFEELVQVLPGLSRRQGQQSLNIAINDNSLQPVCKSTSNNDWRLII